MPQIIDGKRISTEIKEELKQEVAALKEKGITGALAVIQVGDDPASSVYVNNKKKACEYIGIESLEYKLPEETTERELLDLIVRLNEDEKVNGILVQLPVPKHIDEKKIIETISPLKDVDGFHPENVGNLVCPAEFDTGSAKNAMILSVPEGDDKPLKYPLMFSICDVVLINKCDTLCVFDDFSKEAVEERIHKLNPKAEVIFVSAKTGEGFESWAEWLRKEVKEWQK